ncbi:uncharacterized protein LOC108104419 [Drosophila eugracilis]|uniref:uncharacterized protein LOC108104419 n=1 Tax=Drosophila eugracilis TaxID=29029 RepID=UPI0007E844A1|nr:uncharacterized protein LOC108104419 [Drosophila eugracilis]
MPASGRTPQRSLLNAGLRLFITKMGRNQLMPEDRKGLELVVTGELNETLGQCTAGMSSLNSTELFDQMTASTRMSHRLAAALERIQVLEERNRRLKDLALDKSDIFESRGVMLCSRAFDLSRELIVTRMRINDFEKACTQLRRRILELKLRRIQRRRYLCHEVQRLRLAQENHVPTILMRLWHCLRFLWNCVDCLAQVSHGARSIRKADGTIDALNLFVESF